MTSSTSSEREKRRKVVTRWNKCWEHFVQAQVWTDVHTAGVERVLLSPPHTHTHTNFNTAVKNEEPSLGRINQSCRAPLHNPHLAQRQNCSLVVARLMFRMSVGMADALPHPPPPKKKPTKKTSNQIQHWNTVTWTAKHSPSVFNAEGVMGFLT